MFYINHTELIVIKLINFTLFEGENVFFLFNKIIAVTRFHESSFYVFKVAKQLYLQMYMFLNY